MQQVRLQKHKRHQTDIITTSAELCTRPSVVSSSTAILHLRYSFRDIHGEHMYNKRVIVRTNDERHAVYNFALNTTRRLDNVVVCLVVVGAFVTLLDIVVHKTK